MQQEERRFYARRGDRGVLEEHMEPKALETLADTLTYLDRLAAKSPKWKYIHARRFGLITERGATLKQIGIELGMSESAIHKAWHESIPFAREILESMQRRKAK